MLRVADLNVRMNVAIRSDEEFASFHEQLEELIKTDAEQLFRTEVRIKINSREGSFEAIINLLVDIGAFAHEHWETAQTGR